MRDGVRFQPTGKHPPAGVTTATVCEMLNWSLSKLLTHVERGELPPPVWFGGELLWPFNYALQVRCDGLHLPGTYPGFPPGTRLDVERARWSRSNVGGYIRYTARGKRATTKAAKRQRGAS